MPKHNHTFVEEYDGLVGFGLDRETNENTVKYYLQKFSDDGFASLILARMPDQDLESVFNLLSDFMQKYLKEEEYHKYFLKDEDEME
jgi:hypothetical protein